MDVAIYFDEIKKIYNKKLNNSFYFNIKNNFNIIYIFYIK